MNNRLLNYFVSSKYCPFIEQHFQDITRNYNNLLIKACDFVLYEVSDFVLGLGGRVADPPADGGRGHQRRHQTGNPGRLLVPLRMRSSVSEKRVYEKSRNSK